MLTQYKDKHNNKGKIKIFIAFSYDKQDKPLTDKIINFISKEEFGFEPYIVGDNPEVDFLDSQIQEKINESEGIFAIFTKRFTATDTKGGISILPPPMVISESSFAMGRHYGIKKKACAGMVEDGIEINSRTLGLIESRSLRLVPFNREKILNKKGYLKNILQPYLISFKKAITEEITKKAHSYVQSNLEKIIYIYEDGTAISEITCRVIIKNVNDFQGIDHIIFLNTLDKELPSFEEMLKNIPREKPSEFFFSSLINKINNEEINKPFDVIERENRKPQKIPITLKIPSQYIPKRGLQNGDTIDYQYAWSFPNLYRSQKSDNDKYVYDETRVQSTYGELERVSLKLAVEKCFKFSKAPFLKKSSSIDDSATFSAEFPFNNVEKSIIYDIYSYSEENFFGTLKAEWIPI